MRIAANHGWSLRQALDEIDSNEFNLWLAFYGREPFGYDLDNWRAGMIAATVANVTLRPKRPFKPLDFFPGSKRAPRLTERQRRELEKRRAKRRNSNS